MCKLGEFLIIFRFNQSKKIFQNKIKFKLLQSSFKNNSQFILKLVLKTFSKFQH